LPKVNQNDNNSKTKQYDNSYNYSGNHYQGYTQDVYYSKNKGYNRKPTNYRNDSVKGGKFSKTEMTKLDITTKQKKDINTTSILSPKKPLIDRKESDAKNNTASPKIAIQNRENVDPLPIILLSTALKKKSLKVNISSCKNLQDTRTLSNSKVILSPYKNIDITNFTKETFVKTLTAKLDLTKEFTPKKLTLTAKLDLTKEFSPKKVPDKIFSAKASYSFNKEPKIFTFEEAKIDPIPEEVGVSETIDNSRRRCVIF
jgi:hypothetical protein